MNYGPLPPGPYLLDVESTENRTSKMGNRFTVVQFRLRGTDRAIWSIASHRTRITDKPALPWWYEIAAYVEDLEMLPGRAFIAMVSVKSLLIGQPERNVVSEIIAEVFE